MKIRNHNIYNVDSTCYPLSVINNKMAFNRTTIRSFNYIIYVILYVNANVNVNINISVDTVQ